MIEKLKRITLGEWDGIYEREINNKFPFPWYCKRLSEYLNEGDYRLKNLSFDDSLASFHLWNFLLSEYERLSRAKQDGKRIIGVMKDLGTVPVMCYSAPNVSAFYPDGAWWIPCIMEMSDKLFHIADSLGADEHFCPVRAMLGAFVNKEHFPIPDFSICSVGATCDDFSAIAQMTNNLGHDIFWWEIPHRRKPNRDEVSVILPGGFHAPLSQIEFVEQEMGRIREHLSKYLGMTLSDDLIRSGIKKINRIRGKFDEIRLLTFTSESAPIPSLELQIIEMLAIHFCSDIDETEIILDEFLTLIKNRIDKKIGFSEKDAVKIFWINPVADLRSMNMLDDLGGRICGSDFLFCHALDQIPENELPMRSLAMCAIADPMVGAASDRALRIVSDIARFGSEAVLFSKIPGASHCAAEGEIIEEYLRNKLDIPVAEIEIPAICDCLDPNITVRLEALLECAKERRQK